MPQDTVYELRPTGWENDPEVERFKLSTIDRTPTLTYNQYMVFFRADDAQKDQACKILKEGLEKTLSQAKYMCGKIETDPEGGHSFVKRKDSTVRFVIRKFDSGDDGAPSIAEIEKAHFAAHALGGISLLSIPGMQWGTGVAAQLENIPVVAAYQLNLIRDGLLFSMQSHHYATDVMGWANFTRQLADNCRAISDGTPFSTWDPARIDVARFTKDLPEDKLVDGPPPASRHPDHPEQQAVLFHLPKSKAAELKKLATPTDPNAHWISTYDAVCAFIWRMQTKVRASMHKPDLSNPIYWGEAVDMRPRLRNPPAPDRMMRNIVAGAFSDSAPVPPPTTAEVISEAPLPRLAGYVRALTESCTEAHLGRLIDLIAPVRDKRSVSLVVDAHPPMSTFVTDHRSGDVSGLDFGFAKSLTYRYIWGDDVTAGLILIYAPVTSANPDEGCMFTVTMEKELIPKLREDPEWSKYFEYRGVD
ncbi:transferase family-domain-containing protein [Xylariaceae sp. FL0016]|nr:transferase family-domain-containing protein [Xylariaceae sp. FL0016]